MLYPGGGASLSTKGALMAVAQPPVRVIRNQNGRIRAKTRINFLRLLPRLIYTLGSCTIYAIYITLS
jgi:hypothetical protein